jgi:hypothetical protein
MPATRNPDFDGTLRATGCGCFGVAFVPGGVSFSVPP